MPTKSIAILSICLLLGVASTAQNDDRNTRPYQPEINFNQIELFPNPAVEFVIVDIKDSNLKNVKIELRSMIGNKLRIEVERIGPNRYRIPMKDFATGYYFVVVKDEILRFNKAYKILKK